MAQLVEYLPIGLGFESSEPMEKPGTVTSLSVLLPGEIPKTEGPASQEYTAANQGEDQLPRLFSDLHTHTPMRTHVDTTFTLN